MSGATIALRMDAPRQCFECGAEAHHDHHVVPASRGGTKTVPLCAPCHDLAHSARLLDLARRGMERRRESGKWIGRVPFGWRLRADGRLERHDLEYSAVKVARSMRMDGHSPRAIAAALNRWGAGERRWYHSAVCRLLRPDVYPAGAI